MITTTCRILRRPGSTAARPCGGPSCTNGITPTRTTRPTASAISTSRRLTGRTYDACVEFRCTCGCAAVASVPGAHPSRPGCEAFSAQSGHVDLALARPVELAEEDALIAPQGEPAFPQRHEHLWAHQRGAHVRRRVGAVCVVVLPAPAVFDDPLHRRLDVVRESRIDVLVDRHAGGRMGHVDERGGG